MENIFLLTGTAFLLTFLMFPVYIKVLKKKDFLDDPGGRKIHTAKTPAMGGLPIFVGFALSLLMWSPFAVLSEIKYIIGATFIIFVIGFRDDLINLRASRKLLGQMAAILIVVAISDVRFDSLYGLFGITDIPLWLSYLLSIFTIVVITNAYNLIDGIDGLSGAIGLVICLFFGIWFYLMGEIGLASIALALCGAIIAFLNYNWAPAKIFMGDTGSLFIGFFIAIAAIKFIDLNDLLMGQNYTFGASIGTAMAILIVPLADTLRVFTKRILRGKSPMAPDRTHMHHILLRLGANHAQATAILLTVNIIFVLLALVFRQMADLVVIPAVLLTALALSTMLDFIFRSTIDRRKEALREENEKIREETKVVSINKSAS